MQVFCSRCGRPRSAANRFCTGCGAQFPDRPSADFRAAQPPPRNRYRENQYRSVITVVAAAVAVAGLGVGGWFLGTHLVPHRTGGTAAPEGASQAAVSRSTPAAAPSTADDVPTTADDVPTTADVPPDPSPTLPQAVGTVTIGPAAAQDPDASAVADLVNQYFATINSHDFQAYNTLMAPQAQITITQFNSGYRSTVDSDETLTGISSADNGDTEADVTFTSRQDPADSVDGSQSCTDWTISLYLQQNGDGYLIDQPPPSYHASYAACQ